jgi:sulfate transport system permease protein
VSEGVSALQAGAEQAPPGRGLRPASWRRRLLILVVSLYVAALILAPLGGLFLGTFAEGPAAVLRALTDAQVLGAFGRTLEIAAITVAVHLVFGTAAAWVIVRQRFIGRRLLNSLIDLPFAVSAVVVGYMLLLIFGRNGLLAPLLRAFDLRVAFAMPGLVLATIFVTLPFVARELIPVMEALDAEQEHAAATLGAAGWQTFWLVTLPSLRWGMLYGLTLTFARSLGEFGAVLVIGGGIQGRTETATVFVFHALEERQPVAAYAVALVLGLLSLTLVTGVNLLRRRKGLT